MIKTGTIVKGIAGFYYVDTGEKVYECKARGAFKNAKLKPSVGDIADIDIARGDADTGVVVKIHERRNYFLRPPVANIEQFVVVSSLTDPKPNFSVIDKFLAVAEMNNVDIVLCFTKSDLVSEKEIDYMKEVYSSCYPVVFLDLKQENGINDLMPYLFEKRSALAGPSGVGKSTILNALRSRQDPDHEEVETGAVSEKTKRGRHTTRHVELFKMDFGGAVSAADILGACRYASHRPRGSGFGQYKRSCSQFNGQRCGLARREQRQRRNFGRSCCKRRSDSAARHRHL